MTAPVGPDRISESQGEIELAPRPAETPPPPRVVAPRPESRAIVATATPAKPPAARPRAVAPALPPLWERPPDPAERHWIAPLILAVLVALYSMLLSGYYAGAHGGVDQNGYLMTARLITGDRTVGDPGSPFIPTATQPSAVAGTPNHDPVPAAALTPRWEWLRQRLSFVPESPYQFAGRMCIMTEPFGPASSTQPAEYRIYAKYPFGFPLMAAIGHWLWGLNGFYVINPLCTILACYFGYFLFREAVSPFLALMGVIWLGCNPLVLNYANDANSHASTLFCVTAGMWGLLSWLRTGRWPRGVLGAFLLGYACTIRYSEFLLVAPVAVAALLRLQWKWRRLLPSAAVVAAWALPVAVLAGVCWVCFGSPSKTGYAYDHESTAFAWKYLSGDMGDSMPGKTGNWETLVWALNRTGLFLMLPLAVAGLFAMTASSAWRLGVTLAAWIVPPTILYLLYYWAPTGETTVGYLRFFVSIIPGLILAGLWILERGLSVVRGEKWASLAIATGAAILVIVTAGIAARGEAVEIGLGFFPQAWHATWALANGSAGWSGAVLAWGIVALILGMWFFERELVAQRAAIALGVGALTALGCGVNATSIQPSLESAHARWVALRETVDQIQSHLPRGAALFTGSSRFDDSLLNQLDAVGGLRLYSLAFFEQASFADAKRRVDSADKDKDAPEPDPIQVERERFFMDLTGKDTAKGMVVRPTAELHDEEMALIQGLIDRGIEVAFLSPNGDKAMFPVRPGYELREVTRWAPEPEVLSDRAARAAAKSIPPRRAAAYITLYKLVPKPQPAAKPAPAPAPAKRPVAKTLPAPAPPAP